MSRVIVKSLPKYLTEARLRDHFSKAGIVTDAKILKTKEGNSRKFGFVGFASANDAQKAIKMLNGTFVDTSRISVEPAKAVGDASIGRPWSRHTPGSSAYARARPKAHGAIGDDTQMDTEARKEASKKRAAPDDEKVDEEDSEDMKRFLEVMGGAKRKAVWANDDPLLPLPSADAQTEKPEPPKKRARSGAPSALEIAAAAAAETRQLQAAAQQSKKKKETEARKAEDDEEKPAGEEVSPETLQAWEDGRLFVRNLAYATTEKDLRNAFEKFGRIAEVHIPIDRETRRSKGYAFVLYMVPSDALKAYTAMDGVSLQGRLLHILPAKAAPAAARAESEAKKGSFKQKREAEQRSKAQSSFNWNSLFLRQDTVAAAMAGKLKVSKGELLEHDSSNLAVRSALSEAHIIAETKRQLSEAGVDVALLDASEAPERSSTEIIVKNLPPQTRAEELHALFSGHGVVTRLVVPETKVIAVIELGSPAEARAAFKALAYRKYRHVPLFLEWAPAGLMREAATVEERKEQQQAEAGAAEGAEEGAEESGKTTTVFVKNLNFATTEETLRGVFEKAGRVRSVLVMRKRAEGKSKQRESLGFGFVEFADRASAVAAVRTLHATMVDGHALEVTLSSRKSDAAAAAESAEAAGKRRKKSEAPAAAPEGEEQAGKTTKLIVRNVPFEATKKEIRELFAAFAQVRSVRLPKRADGRHRGFAFVEFLTRAEAASAMESVRSAHFYGRHLVVEYAEATDNFAGAPALSQQ
eukprot:m51a1_g1735 hypothetical protein (754) ;mRNA; r:161398-164064